MSFPFNDTVTLGNKAKGSVGGNNLEGRNLAIKAFSRVKRERLTFSSHLSVSMSNLGLTEVIEHNLTILVPEQKSIDILKRSFFSNWS